MTQTGAASLISAQVAGIRAGHHDRARERVTTFVDDEGVICALRFELSLAERVLIAQGHRRAVIAHRRGFEPALAPAMRAAVERTTGRTVATVVADTSLDPDMTVLTFTFAPAPAALSASSPSAAHPPRRLVASHRSRVGLSRPQTPRRPG